MSSTTITDSRRSIWARLWLHNWRGRLLWAVVMGFVAALACVFLIRMTPGWYRPLDPGDEVVNGTALRAQTLLAFELRRAAQSVPLQSVF